MLKTDSLKRREDERFHHFSFKQSRGGCKDVRCAVGDCLLGSAVDFLVSLQ